MFSQLNVMYFCSHFFGGLPFIAVAFRHSVELIFVLHTVTGPGTSSTITCLLWTHDLALPGNNKRICFQEEKILQFFFLQFFLICREDHCACCTVRFFNFIFLLLPNCFLGAGKQMCWKKFLLCIDLNCVVSFCLAEWVRWISNPCAWHSVHSHVTTISICKHIFSVNSFFKSWSVAKLYLALVRRMA